jgi:hypothetical protein
MIYIKLNSEGLEIDRIIADADFIANLPGDWRELTPELETALLIKALRSAMFLVFAGLSAGLRDKWYLEKVKITAAFDDGDVEVAVMSLVGLDATTQDEIDAKALLVEIVAPFIPV